MKKPSFLLFVCVLIATISGCKKDMEVINIHYVDHEVVYNGSFIKEIVFLDEQHAMMATYYDEVFFSDDGGATWTNEGTFGNNDVVSIYYTSIDTAYAITYYTSNRYMYRTVNRGVSWTQLNVTFQDYASGFFFTSNRAIVVDAMGNFNHQLNRTSNYGNTWTTSTNCPYMYKLFAEGSTYFGIDLDNNSLRKSSDAGVTWYTVTGDYEVNDYVMLPDVQRGFLITQSGEVYSSTDFGSTWTLSNHDPAGSGIRYIDALSSGLVVAAGNGALLISEDFGATWEYRSFRDVPYMSEYRFYTVDILNASTIILCGEDENNDDKIFKVTL